MSWRDVLPDLKGIVGEDHVLDDPRSVSSYLEDETEPRLKPTPCGDVAVVKPRDAEQVSRVLRLCGERGVSVFVRGGGTGVVGGCVPNRPGIVLSMELFRDLQVDLESAMIEAGAGITLGELSEAAERAGFFFPPHPGSEGAQVGGLIASNAVGARAVRTGPIRNFVLGLEVVTPTGGILKLGGKLLKDNATAGKLMHLFIGTEGILGVITRAVLRLWPKPRFSATLVASFEEPEGAIAAVQGISRRGLMPMGLEYVEREDVEPTAERLGLSWPLKSGTCYLMVMLVDQSEEGLSAQLSLCDEALSSGGALEVVVAESQREQSELLKIRSEIYPTMKQDIYDTVDITVPPSRLGELVRGLKGMGREVGIRISLLGHAGDGNLHPSIMIRQDLPPEGNEGVYRRIKEEMYRLCKELGGTITGEHGIGEIRVKAIHWSFGQEELELLRSLKRTLDPKGILNPGKVLPG